MRGAIKLMLVVSVAISFLFIAIGEPLADVSAEANTAKFKFKSSSKLGRFPYKSLKSEWLPVSGGALKIEGKAGPIAVVAENRTIQYDVMGDGRQIRTIKIPGGIATIVTKEGIPYAIELKNDSLGRNNNWSYRRACYMVGKIGGQQVILVDENSNGKYNDIGVDGIIVGSGKFACPLGKMILCGKKFYEIEINPGGAGVTYKEANPTTGHLDMRTNFIASGKLMAAIISNGDNYFNMAGFSPKTRIPVGEYKYVGGRVETGRMYCDIQGKEFAPITVSAANESNFFVWGGNPKKKGAFKAVFGVTKSGNKVTCHVNQFHVFGIKGEEYINFKPNLYPLFEIADRRTGKIITKGRVCST